MNFLLKTAFATSHKFLFSFLPASRFFFDFPSDFFDPLVTSYLVI